ncbi:Adenosine receptor A2b [Trichoplax sp. H2]|nr:Adenosine receptor A2b [Trichoplax sp. H2]|eukprot:RDD40400.1 Adenosine receptor A2b [Trichoplax sp. H2]
MFQLATVSFDNTNTTLLPTSDFKTNPLQLVTIATLSIIAMGSVVGNSFCLATIYATPSLHKVNNILLANMAAADLSIGMIALPAMVVVVWLDYPIPTILCQFQGFVLVYLYPVSLLTVTAITVDRILAITRPLHYSDVITYKFRWILGIIWIAPFTIALMPVMQLEQFGFGNYDKVMVCWIDLHHRSHRPYTFSAILLTFIIGIILAIIGCYTAIFIIACRKTVYIPHRSSQDMVKSIRTTALIVGTSILCWILLAIDYFIDLTRVSLSKRLSIIEILVSFAAISNSMINPIVYVSTNTILRRKFLSLFKVFPTATNRIQKITVKQSSTCPS